MSKAGSSKSRASASLSHHLISLARKVEIIKAVESSQKSKSSIAEKFGTCN